MPQLQVVNTSRDKPEPTGVQEFFSRLGKDYKNREDQVQIGNLIGEYQKNREDANAWEDLQLGLEKSTISPSRRIEAQQNLNAMRKNITERDKNLNRQVQQTQQQVEKQRLNEAQQAEQQATKQKSREALQESGATPEQIKLFEVSPVGGQTKIVENIAEKQSREQAPTGLLAPELVDYDKGLTPKERVKRQESRYSVQTPLVIKNSDALHALENENLSIGLLQELDESGKVQQGFQKLNINPKTGDLFLPQAATPEEQLFVKTVNDFTVKAKDSFGARVTNFELDRFMQRLPTLANSKEGRGLIMRQMQIVNQINQLEKKAIQDVFDQYGVRNIDYADAENKARTGIKDEKETLRKEYFKLEQVAKQDRKEEVKKLLKNVLPGYTALQKPDGTIKQFENKNVASLVEKGYEKIKPTSGEPIEEKSAPIEKLEDNVDYDAIYGAKDIEAEPTEKSPELKDSYAKVLGDIAKQGVKETLIGAGGAYGDLQQLLGAPNTNEAANERTSREFQTLTKMEQPGYEPTYADIASLTEESDRPIAIGFPTSQNLRDVNEMVGGPGEPETTAGKYAQRAGKLYGSGLAFGQVNPAPASAAGIVGQGIEDLGGGPLLQAAGEIVTLLATQGKGPKGLIGSNKAVQEKINHLKQIGYTDQDITLAINSSFKGGKRASIASKGAKTEKAFENFANNSEKIVQDILSSEIPGFEKGTKHVHKMASDAYGEVAKKGAEITITEPRPFLDASKKVIDQIQNTLGTSEDAKGFIKRISEAAMDATQYPSAETMMNFYQELNSMGKWMGRSKKDRLITQLKNGIKDTFKKQGKQGEALAEDFEKVNLGIKKAYDAEEVAGLFDKVRTQEGIDFKKMNKIFDDPEDVQLLKDTLGTTQQKNLHFISNIGKDIKDFDKAWKTANAIKIGTVADVVRGGFAMHYLYQQDWSGLASVLATKAGTSVAKKLAEKSLTDPKFQNLMIKGLHAIKSASPQGLKSANEGMKKYFEQEGIDITLD